jgi:hypothetical protein
MTARMLAEFRAAWLPHVTDSGLLRVTTLLEKASPLLSHGTFCHAVPQGCLASQFAWHHPATEHLQTDAGVRWLTKVARLNPATSLVVRAWDVAGVNDFALRGALLRECRAEFERREEYGFELAERELELVPG